MDKETAFWKKEAEDYEAKYQAEKRLRIALAATLANVSLELELLKGRINVSS